MKNLIITIVGILLIATSCQNPEDKAIKIIREFYADVHKNGASKFNGSLKKSREVLNYKHFSPDMENVIKNHFIGVPKKENYELTTENKGDKIILTSIGKSKGIFGNLVEKRRQYLFEKVNGNWKITDSYHQIGFNLNFKIDDTQWNFYWDLKKAKILDEVRKNISLEIISKGKRPSYGGDSKKGKLKVINNSDFDVKNIEILIEHFDKNGISVNTDSKTVYDIIRSKGYREFDWYTSDCAKCVTQTFKIKFVSKTIK